MFLQEPPGTQYDLKFRILGIPVRIHPMFWLISAVLGMSSRDISALLAWVVTMFSTIIVHELGHALAGIKFGSRGVRIVLHGMGGLAIGATGRTRNERIAVIAAGPVTQFLFAIPFMAVFVKSKSGLAYIHYHVPSLFPVFKAYADATGYAVTLPSVFLQQLFYCISVFTIFWVLLNLIPVFPLDGGQICAEVLMGKDPVDGMATTHKVSIVTVVAVCVGLYKFGQATGMSFTFVIILLLLLGYQNYQLLKYNNRSYW